MHHYSSQNEFSLFVGDLPLDCNEDKLQRLFQLKFKSVKRVQIIKNEDGSSRGFGFIRFEDRAELQAALTQEMKIGNVNLRLDMAHVRDHGNRKKNRSRYNSFNSTSNNNGNHSNTNNHNHHEHHNHQQHQHHHQNVHQQQHHHNFNHRANNNNNNNSHTNQIQNNNNNINHQSQQPSSLDNKINATSINPLINNKSTNETKLSDIKHPAGGDQTKQQTQPIPTANVANSPGLTPHTALTQPNHANLAQHQSTLTTIAQPSPLQASPQVTQSNQIIQPNSTLNQPIHPSLASVLPQQPPLPHQQQQQQQPSHHQPSNMMTPTSVYGHMYPYGPPTFGYMPAQPNPVIPISGVTSAAAHSPSTSVVNQQHSVHSLNAATGNPNRYNSGTHHTHQQHHVQAHATDSSGLGMVPGGVQGPHQGAPQLYYYYHPSPLYFDHQATSATGPPSLYHPQSFHPQFFAMPNPAYMSNAHTYNQHLTHPPPTGSQSDAAMLPAHAQTPTQAQPTQQQQQSQHIQTQPHIPQTTQTQQVMRTRDIDTKLE